MASDDKTGPDGDAVEGSWSPKRPKTSSRKTKAGGSPDTEALTQEIEQTREELAETLDAIADRVSPKKVVGRTKKAAKDGAHDAAEAVKDTAASAAQSVKGGVAAVKEKVSGEDTVALSAAEVPLEPAPTPGALADASFTVAEPAGSETPSYGGAYAAPARSKLPVFAGAGALLVLLYLVKRRRR